MNPNTIKSRKPKKLEERVEPDPKDQKIKELQKEVNALVNLALCMQEREHAYHVWLSYSLEYLNKDKPDGYEVKLKELEDAWREYNHEFTRLVKMTSSFQVKTKPSHEHGS